MAIATRQKLPARASDREGVEAIADASGDARLRAAGETDLPLSRFPAACPDDWTEAMERAFETEF